MKKMKKVLSLVLVLIMVLSLFPVSAFAEFNGMLGSIWEPGEDIEPLPLPTTLPEVEEPEEEEAVLFDSVEQTFYVEDENGVAVDVEAPAGALPMGADLVVSSVAPETIQADVDALLGAESNVLLAMDISFVDENGVEVHPAADVKVMLSGGALAEKENLQVVHFPDETLEPELVTQLDANDVAFEYGTNVAFQSKDFSVYAVVDPADDGPARDTYYFEKADGTPFLFYNTAGDQVDNQIIKNGEYLEDVGLPTILATQTFLGWYLYDKDAGTFGDKITFGEARTVEQGANHTFYVRPKLETVVYLTFYNDAEGFIIKDRVQVIVTSGTNVTYDLTTKDATPPNGNLAFVGWTDTLGGEEPIAEATAKAYPVTENKNFFPVFKSSHWLSYWTAAPGAGATYIAPSHVLVGHNASETMTTEVPKVKGYTFRYWTTEDQSGNWSKVEGQDKWVYNVPENDPPEFNADQQLSADTTLYAVWANAESSYRVIIWHQSIDDNKNATEKTYEQFSQDLRKKAATETVYTTAEDRTAPVGFVYNEEKSDTSAVVNADGTTVLNVYFDRKLITMNFTRDTYTEVTDHPTTATQYYYRNNNGGWSQAWFRWNNGGWQVRYNGSWYSVNVTPYQLTSNSFQYTGLYGQPLSKYDFEWPEGTWRYANSDGGTTGMSYLGQFVLPTDVADSSGTVINFTGTESETSKIDFYLQNNTDIVGETRTYPDSPNDTGYGTAGAAFSFSEKYDGYSVAQYRLYTEDANGNKTYYRAIYHEGYGGYFETRVSDEWTDCDVSETPGTGYVSLTAYLNDGYDSSQYNLEIRYALKDYAFKYLDSIDGQEVLTTIRVYYGASLEDYKPTSDQESTIESQTPGKQFNGKWYKDQGCQTEFDWTATMPNADYQAYAGWEDIWYWAKVDPDGGVINAETTGSTWFWNTYGESVTEYNFVKREYVESETGTYYYHNHQLPHPMNMTWEETDEERQNDPSYAYYTTDASKSTDGGKKYALVEKAYDLIGWYVVDMETGETTDELFNFDTPMTSNIWIRAKWHRNGDFPIYYSAEGVDKTGAELKDENDQRITGANAPTDVARYDDGANSAMLIACDAPAGYVFLGWYYAGKVYDPGEKFVVDAAQANDEDRIVIYAVYEKINSVPVRVTHITWYDNFTENPASPANYKTVDNLQINKAIAIEPSTLFSRPGYKFLGWARVDTTDAQGNPVDGYKLEPRELGRDKLYLTWHDADDTHENGYYTVNHNGVDKEVTQVAADEIYPYHDMYAVWELSHYYVYHTGSGRLYAFEADGHAPNFFLNFDNGHVEYPNEDLEYLYGGYSTTYYANMTITDEQKTAAATSTTGYTTIDAYKYSPYAYFKSGDTRYKWWKSMDTLKPVDGTLEAQAGNVYFVKEVPTDYLTSRIQFVYENWSGQNKLESMYFLSVLDDRLYDSAWFELDTTMKIVSSFNFVEQSNKDKPDPTPSTKTTKATDFANISYGFVGYANMDGALSSYKSGGYYSVTGDTEFSVTPYWKTVDGIEVEGTARKFDFNANNNAAGDYATKDSIGEVKAKP